MIQVIKFLIITHLLRMAMFRTLGQQAGYWCLTSLNISEMIRSYSHHLLIYRIKLTANCILKHLAAENTVINYLSRHFDHRKIPAPSRCRLSVRRLFGV